MTNWRKLIKSIEKGEGIYKIYALISSEDFNDIKKGDIIYIGITSKTLGNRLSGHKSEHINWPDKININLIENTNDKSRESFYIDFFKKMGCNLLNKNNGIRPNIEKKSKLTDEQKKERLKEYRKTYYLKNKEKLNDKMKLYQEKNKEKLKEYRREYYKQYNSK
jgi:hypothetical protein